MAQDEQVLVVQRKVFEEVGAFNGLAMNTQKYLDKLFAPGVPRFMPRPQAEKDPFFKQLIPYVIMTCNGKYLSYVRGKRAGETRLVAKRSIGIGGHINPSEDMPLFGKLSETNLSVYRSAVQREVAEEVSIETKYGDRVVALLNDDSNEVGQVHLGIVHLWTLDEPKVERREQMITQMGFMSIPELREVRDTMETWSQLCLDGLAKI
jgi:predicted NUDIX family phosphoesterase